MKGLTFYKLVSPYPEDVTKNCGLLGTEIDENFFHLKEEDIRTAYWENDVLILERVDGDVIKVSGITEGCTKNLEIDYDAEKGVLIVKHNGTTEEISGFTGSNALSQVYSDSTMTGKGTKKSPIGISPIAQTGTFKPVIKLIDTINGEKLPFPNKLIKGNRYLTLERISDYGYLYNYDAVTQIQKALDDCSSEWRVPTKEDWDNMLNAVEPCPQDRNHQTIAGNRFLGKLAGKLLKSNVGWRTFSPSGCTMPNYSMPRNNYNADGEYGFEDMNYNCPTGSTSGNCNCDCGCDCSCPPPFPPCPPCPPPCPPLLPNGVDAFGFKVMPAGYGDGGSMMDYFGSRACFWTNTQSHVTDVYVKRFDYDKTGVYQGIEDPNSLYSLRLVKDYNGSNHFDTESIGGMDYSTVLMPSSNGNHTIWTSTNIAFSNRQYKPVEPNLGVGLTYTDKYFINEWDGFKWIKNELREGESVVIFNALNGGTNIEYRIIDGALVNVSDAVYQDIMTVIKPTLDKIKDDILILFNRVSNIETNVSGLTVSLNAEIQRSIEADKALDSKIDAETERSIEADKALDGKIDNETERAIEAEKNLDNKIDEEINRSVEADKALDAKLDAEIARAIESETNLDKKLDEEINRSVEADKALDAKLDDEINRSVEADKALDAKLDNEIARAIEAEKALDTKLDEEINRSVEADKALDSKIDEEIARAIENETNIVKQLEAETARAIEAEKNLDTKIDNETTRAIEAETNIVKQLEAETARAIEAEKNLDTKIDNETARAIESETKIIGRLISKTGSVFSLSEGTLTLKTDDDANTIVIELDGNYGTF